MSKTYLLVDFGASRIKTAILSRGSIMFVKEFPSIDAKINDNKYYEISAEKLKSFFLNLAQNQYKEYSYAGILISSEMHGFMLVDSKNKPLTDYISWKDERCLNEENIEEYNQFSNKFKSVFLKKTGLELKPCLPVTKIKAVANECKLKNFKVISLPEWLSCCSELSLNIANETMSAGLGFYNIIDKKWDEELIDYFKDFKIEFNKKEDYKAFKKMGYNIIRDQKQYNQVTVNIKNEEVNKLFKDLHGLDVKFLSEVKYTLEKHFREVLKKKKESNENV